MDRREDFFVLNALSVESRLRILSFLVNKGPMTISEIVDELGELFQANMSTQIKGLEVVGLVEKTRDKRKRNCSAIFSTICVDFKEE